MLENARSVENYMEKMVDEYLENLLHKPQSFCTCPRCILKIKKEALNCLPTFYVTGKVGEVYGAYHTMQQQHSADIMVAVSKAIERVSQQGHTGF